MILLRYKQFNAWAARSWKVYVSSIWVAQNNNEVAVEQRRRLIHLNFAMTCCLEQTVNIDPLMYWMNHPHMTYKVRLCDNDEPEKNTILHLRPDNTLQITWWDTDWTTEAHGLWRRTYESAVSISSDKLREPNGQERQWIHFVLLKGTCVYREVGMQSKLYLMPYTSNTYVGPSYSIEYRTEPATMFSGPCFRGQ